MSLHKSILQWIKNGFNSLVIYEKILVVDQNKYLFSKCFNGTFIMPLANINDKYKKRTKNQWWKKFMCSLCSGLPDTL